MSKPVVAIVGRPNVGKSTLFNRIIGRREAIVDDEPGITRDRKYADAEWESRPFLLIDTGGYVPKTKDAIESGISRQVLEALAEADVVLFLVDCHTGITDVDGEVARLLRGAEKTVILAVNKVDNASRENEAFEFVRLGLGDPVAIAALEGLGIGDLLSDLVAHFPDDTIVEEEDDSRVKLAIVGRPNAGKSTFINTLLGQERLIVTDIPGTTRDAVDVDLIIGDREFVLIDTAGLRKQRKVNDNIEFYSNLRTHRAIEACDVACLFVDASRSLEQQDMRVLKEIIDARKGVVIVANKWDLVKNNEELLMIWKDELDKKMHGFAYVPVLTISCLENMRVNKVLDTAWVVAKDRHKRLPSPDLNRWLEKLNQRYQPPAIQGKRIRIQFVTQIGVTPPKFAFFANHPHLLKVPYKRFLENQLREAFGYDGVTISFVFRKK
ncbi:ribosome biogenesis GTPase Der [bacterium]|nr:ribosome biogenesis GTPase Der [bacterium]